MKKPLIVQKFGGTSVGSIERIQSVAEQVIQAKLAGNRLVVVVSAMSGETNRLVELAKQIDSVPNARELDVLLSTGEQVSMALLAMALSKLGHHSVSLTGHQAQIQTNNLHNHATISEINPQAIQSYLDDDLIVIVAGFQGVNALGDITTLGRGGSDTTAVTLAGALLADECQIYTDVAGVYTADPRIVVNAKCLESIDFTTMEVMSKRGAKVLHLPCVMYAGENDVPLRVLSSFESGAGTLVKGRVPASGITGVALQKHLIAISIPLQQKQRIDQQIKLCGIEIDCQITDDADYTLIAQPDAIHRVVAMLSEVAAEKSPVGLVTVVGDISPPFTSQSQQLLNLAEISVLHFCEDKHSFTFVIASEAIDKAANVLHDNYIISNDTVSREEKLAYLG